MEELQVKFDGWKEAFKRIGLKVNMGKIKLMVSDEEGERVVSRMDPCGVCDRRVGANSILCKGCNKWVHKRCSGVKGALARVVESFRCRRCLRGIAQAMLEAGMTSGIEKVGRFVYVGDKLNSDGGCLSAVTTRVRVGCMKLKELSGVLCGRSWSLRMKGRVNRSCVKPAIV